jgi:hypothetical protein
MIYSPSFCRLLTELEQFQLPPRRRVEAGDCVKGRVKAQAIITATATGAVAVPPVLGTISATISMRAVLRSRQRSIPLKVKKPTEWRPSRPKVPRKAKESRISGEVLPRPKRSQAAIDAAAQKTRAQREARVAALLPLVAEARAQGAVLLKDICLYLDSVGHKPQRGKRWSTGTLSSMLPGEDDRRAREATFVALISQASGEGAANTAEIAAWLNDQGHRTMQDRAWTSGNVYSFIKTRPECWSTAALLVLVPGKDERKARDAAIISLVEQARREGAQSNGDIAVWLNERGHRTTKNVQWTRFNLHSVLARIGDG